MIKFITKNRKVAFRIGLFMILGSFFLDGDVHSYGTPFRITGLFIIFISGMDNPTPFKDDKKPKS